MRAFLKIPLRRDSVIAAYKRDVDVSLIVENLQLTPQQRLEKLFQLQQFASELRLVDRTNQPRRSNQPRP